MSWIAPDAVTGQAWWGYTQTVAGIAIALLSPVLGAIADAAEDRDAPGAADASVRRQDHFVRVAFFRCCSHG